jgi:hypothetical protein
VGCLVEFGVDPGEGSSTGRHTVQKSIASLMAVGLLLLAACGTGGEVEPGPVTSFEDIAGTTYERQGIGTPGYIHFFEDGTWHSSSNPDLVEERPGSAVETRFEGTKIFVTQTKGQCVGMELPDAIYEIHLLENGNLEFVAIEDPCAPRLSALTVEWAPVP